LVNGSRQQRAKWRSEIRQLKIDLRRGSSIGSNNIAATYRQLGNFRRAFHWWKRAAESGDDDDWLEVGYCLQYGIGTRRDRAAAITCYRTVVKSDWVTAFGQEEAQYQLAIALLDRGLARDRAEVERLLAQAAADGDYSQASGLLRQLQQKQTLVVCRCRRRLSRRLGGKAQCSLHRGATARKRH